MTGNSAKHTVYAPPPERLLGHQHGNSLILTERPLPPPASMGKPASQPACSRPAHEHRKLIKVVRWTGRCSLIIPAGRKSFRVAIPGAFPATEGEGKNWREYARALACRRAYRKSICATRARKSHRCSFRAAPCPKKSGGVASSGQRSGRAAPFGPRPGAAGLVPCGLCDSESNFDPSRSGGKRGGRAQDRAAQQLRSDLRRPAAARAGHVDPSTTPAQLRTADQVSPIRSFQRRQLGGQ